MPRPLLAIAGVVLVAVLLVLARPGGDAHRGRVVLVVDEAASMFEGVPVRASGNHVGSVADARPTGDGRARITLDVDDRRVWPLPTDSRFRLRFGGTISTSNRYIEIVRGSAASRLSDGALIAARNIDVPLEVDALTGTLDDSTQRDLRTLVRRGGGALEQGGPALRRALGPAPDALGEARAVMGGLGADPASLATLVRAADAVTATIEASDPAVGALVEQASGALGAVGAETRALQGTLTRAPAVLRQTQRTLATADDVLRTAGTLTRRVGPGVTEARRLAAPLARILGTVEQTGPDVRTALATLRRAAPDIDGLLGSLRTTAPQLRDVAAESARQLACVRPYAPELAGFFSTWAGFTGQGDKKDKYARITIQTTVPITTGMPITTPQLSKLFPGLTAQYAFPRPPGANAGKPWFIPECGVGPDSVDPTKDPEARPFDPLSKTIISAAAPAGRSR